MQFNTNYNGSNSVRYRSTRFDVQKLSKVKFYTIQYLIYVCVYKIPNLVEASWKPKLLNILYSKFQSVEKFQNFEAHDCP